MKWDPDWGLDGRVVVITGASSGLGAEAALGFARAGANLVIIARRTSRLEAVREGVVRLGRQCVTYTGDVGDPATGTAAVERALDAFGRVDVLLNNAGKGTAYPATRETPQQFRDVVDVNLLGAYWVAQACGRVMSPGSSIINVSSVLAFTTAGLPQAAYASSKAALIALTRDLAGQWSGRKGIRVNALAPGFFATEMTDEYPSGYLEGVIEARVPMGRSGDPEEFVAAALFLASPMSSYITGAVLPVDGGMLTT